MRYVCLGALLLLSESALWCQTPAIATGGVLNGATFDKTAGAPLAPGQLVSIFGTDLASQLQGNDTVPLSTSLADKVSVTFNGVTAGLDFVSPTQVNAQLPWNVLSNGASTGTASVVVTRNGVSSAQAMINIAASAPGIFTIPPGGGWAVAINSDSSLAAPAGAISGINTHPAKTGDVLIIYATGLGQVDTAIANGGIPDSGKVVNTMVMPTVLIGGVPAQVFFSGLTPQFPGVNQLNVQVPAGVPSGTQALQLQINGGPLTPANATIAIQ